MEEVPKDPCAHGPMSLFQSIHFKKLDINYNLHRPNC